MKRPNVLSVLLLLLGLSVSGFAQTNELPVSTKYDLVFVEPFRDKGPDYSQSWLSMGLSRFIESGIAEAEYLKIYPVDPIPAAMLERPHELQELIWDAVFSSSVANQYATYLLRGSYSYLEDEITVFMDLYTLKNTQILAHFEKTLPYTKLLSWKDELGSWLSEQLQQNAPESVVTITEEGMETPGSRNVENESFGEKIRNIFSKKDRKSSADLYSEYDAQSRQALGSQLEQLWHAIAYDPYLSSIHDIEAMRLQNEPDSIQISFKITYRVNPRILDEIAHFTKTRKGQMEGDKSFKGHVFMDLGYIDEDFVREIAKGDWRLVPIIRIGPENGSQSRLFYYSYPRPVHPPSSNHFNMGKFSQMLIAVPGVNTLRIFAREEATTYSYELRVGFDEIQMLDKIHVEFVPERELQDHL